MAEPTEPTKPVERELTGKIGQYEIIRPLGKGAMGQVYLAQDTMLDREVALKVMVAQIADDPELKQRFEREARSVAKMKHPNVVMVYNLGNHTDGSPFIAMELLKGQDLQKAVRQTPPMTLERKVAVIIQVLSFKLTGKRVFRMAPLHHHFEEKGWRESTVVVRFWIISVVLALVSLATLKLR